MYRTDGYRIVSDDPMYEIAAFVMDKRYDASNYIKQDINLDLLQNYIRKCRQKGISMSHMAIIIAGYIRLVSQNSHLNRFVINKRIYARNHFCVSFVTLTQTKAGSTVAKVYFDLDDDIFTVNKKLSDVIEKIQDSTVESSMDRLAKKLVRVPGLLSVAVGFFKFLDKFFALPFSIVDASPFHTSLFVTNLASIRAGAAYHHLYQFGTTGIFVSLGQPSKKLFKNGETIEEHKVMEMGITTDERIADGHYYSRCFKELKKYYCNPEILEKKPESIIRDPDIKKKNPKYISR